MSQRPRFHELDLLRGIACAMVLMFHYLYRGAASARLSEGATGIVAQVAEFGYLGVHLFFIISGFVIVMSAEGATVRQFVASRAARLYPAMWVAAPLTAAVAWLLGAAALQVSPGVLLMNLTMVPQWFDVSYVDGSYWSLAVELQFYLLVTVALALGVFRHVERLAFGWLLLGLIDQVRPIYLLEFWLSANWAQYFCAGIACYLIRQRGATPSRWLLFATSAVLMLAPWIRAGQFAEAAIVSGFLVVFALIALGRVRASAGRLAAFAGAMTYPVYLVHQNLGYMLIEAMKPWGVPFALRAGLVTLVVVGIAWVIHRRVEKPLSRLLRRGIEGTPQRGGLTATQASR